MCARSCPDGAGALCLSPLLMLHLGPRNLRVAQLLKPEVLRLGLHSFYDARPVVVNVEEISPYCITHPVLDDRGGETRRPFGLSTPRFSFRKSVPEPPLKMQSRACIFARKRAGALRCAEPFPLLTQPIPPSPSAHPATAERWQAEPSFRGPGLRQRLLSPPLRHAERHRAGQVDRIETAR